MKKSLTLNCKFKQIDKDLINHEHDMHDQEV